ncbi:MAG: hypothetical protein AAB582_00385 [Patescibacteria group bacterium]
MESRIESVEDALMTHLWVTHRRRTQVLATIAIVFELCAIAGLVVAAFALGSLETFVSNATGVVLVLSLPIAPFLIAYGLARRVVQKQFYKEIAASYGFAYSESAAMNTVTGQIFSFGHSRRLADVFSGTYEGRPTRFFTFHYTTGSHKHRTYHQMLVWEVECAVPMLDLLVRPKRWSGARDWSPHGTRILRLEGPFNDQFDVYTSHEMEVEALTVLDPAFMASYMDSFGSYGFECVGTKIYIFSLHSLPQSRTAFEETFKLIDILYDHLVPTLKNVSDDVVALREAYKRT